jgi:hypothetical protein
MLRLRSFMALSTRAILNAMARGRRQGQRMDAVTGYSLGAVVASGIGVPLCGYLCIGRFIKRLPYHRGCQHMNFA